jgi:hypothetical protein
LYVFEKSKTETEREHNKETRILAENIRAKRQLELQAGNYGFPAKTRRFVDFLKYFQEVAEKRCKSTSTRQSWNNAFLYLKDFTSGQCTSARLFFC